MFYPNKPKFDKTLFENPTSEYKGAPFWAWNCKLEEKELLWQIEQFKEMGFGGFHMHSRSGLDTEYLSEEYMNMVKACVKKAKEEKMFAYLYDEDRWPSGAAGGLATKNRKYAKRNLKLSVNEEESFDFDVALNEGKTYHLATYDVVLDEEGILLSCEMKEENFVGQKWYAYVCADEGTSRFAGQPYLDVLSKEAVDNFIETTYKRYKDELGEDFGKASPSIFTDEPAMQVKVMPKSAHDTEDIFLCWTLGFEKDFEEFYGYSLLDKIPEIIWETGKANKVRYDYHRYLTERFAMCYYDNIGKWCEENNIYFTGHAHSEENLEVQMDVTNDCMRMYRNMQLPGIDILSDRREFTTAKQVQSVANQYGREGVCSELYGVTDWDFDFRGHKAQGDWQAALGVTFRAHHLAWLSMKGQGKRDYPASINYQSPWYKEYKYIEDNFGRLNTALTRGKSCAKVGVIHPIETYWMNYGTKENTKEKRNKINKQFENINMWILSELIDFDYISESLLPYQYKETEKGFAVGEMCYEVIVVSGCETLRKTTTQALENFSNNGGKIIFTDCPKYIEAEETDRLEKLYEKSIKVENTKEALSKALAEIRDIDITENEQRCSELLYSLKEEENCKWLFVASMYEKEKECATKISIKGEYTPIEYDTLTGEIKNIDFEMKDGNTVVYKTFRRNDSLLLRLEKVDRKSYYSEKTTEEVTEKISFEQVEYELEEENVILLDMGEYKIDDGEYCPSEEIRKIDRTVRQQLGIIVDSTQPWAIKKEPPKHTVTMRFKFFSEIEYENPYLATEDSQNCTIVFNNDKIENQVCGYFTDKAIEKIKLTKIIKGENVLEITYPVARHTSLENCFVLGDFGVKLTCIEKTVTDLPAKIAFGDISQMLMPFYGGNIIYKLPFEEKQSDIKIKVKDYKGALIKVYADDKEERMVFAPYECSLENVKSGIIKVKLFGNRANSFGALHIINTIAPWGCKWIDPDAWEFMKDGTENWTYEYLLKPFGLEESPTIEIKNSRD